MNFNEYRLLKAGLWSWKDNKNCWMPNWACLDSVVMAGIPFYFQFSVGQYNVFKLGRRWNNVIVACDIGTEFPMPSAEMYNSAGWPTRDKSTCLKTASCSNNPHRNSLICYYHQRKSNKFYIKTNNHVLSPLWKSWICSNKSALYF